VTFAFFIPLTVAHLPLFTLLNADSTKWGTRDLAASVELALGMAFDVLCWRVRSKSKLDDARDSNNRTSSGGDAESGSREEHNELLDVNLVEGGVRVKFAAEPDLEADLMTLGPGETLVAGEPVHAMLVSNGRLVFSPCVEGVSRTAFFAALHGLGGDQMNRIARFVSHPAAFETPIQAHGSGAAGHGSGAAGSGSPPWCELAKGQGKTGLTSPDGRPILPVTVEEVKARDGVIRKDLRRNQDELLLLFVSVALIMAVTANSAFAKLPHAPSQFHEFNVVMIIILAAAAIFVALSLLGFCLGHGRALVHSLAAIPAA
jgi:hypothetical protein